ncbi:kinase-like domain-containing protein [Thelephora terrestris]|uniref:Kinase-like domain-containing protein n=1 Tax=Thelephora terrestris TaxID=56493 RepID=A0A9P6LAY1_9AGAM|nr:kinase-like domain-containing protein [Thelephora terrestris]
MLGLRKALRLVYKPSDEILLELDHLERSSPNFPDRLINVLSRENLVRHEFLARLRGGDNAWLIEYLDNVCVCVRLYSFHTEPAQALDTLDPVGLAHQKCLDVLRSICFILKRLPRSYILDISSFVPVDGPTSNGPYEIIYAGSINGSNACAKKLNPSLSSEWSHVEKWNLDQIVKWGRLMHPNIVPFLGITNEPTNFVWARTPGVELNKYITNHPDTNRLDLLIGIADGLNHLHSRDMIHGDLGGPNIIVDDSGRPCIMEYGLADLFLWPSRANVCCCMRWADPQMPCHENGDVFSFAMVMVEVYTGQAPFFPEPDSAALSALERGERPERPTHMDLTAKLWALMEQCWQEDCWKRPEMLKVLGILHDCRNDKKALIPVLPPAPSDWFSNITDEILDLTDQVASVALFGPIGIGKSFVARTVLDHDRTKAMFGENRHFVRCDDLGDSLEDFIQRLSDTVGRRRNLDVSLRIAVSEKLLTG